LTLRPEGHDGLRFQPGQFVWLSLEKSPFRAREHPFSIASAAADGGGALQFTVKELGDFTRTIGRTPEGAIAWVDGPHGVFTVDRHSDAPAFAFIAGGVGIAPIMSMLRTLDLRGEPRPLRLLYANEAWAGVLFREDLADLETRLDLEVTHVLATPPEVWEGEEGLLTPELVGRLVASVPRGTDFFLCGPKPMSDLAERALREHGVPVGRIHWELFDMA
jgi:predicted ferric reductase